MTKLDALKEHVAKVCSKIEKFGINTVGFRDFITHVTEIPDGMHRSLTKWLQAFEDNEVADLIYMDGYLPLERRLQIEKLGNTDFQEYRKYKQVLNKVKKAVRMCPGAFKRTKEIRNDKA